MMHVNIGNGEYRIQFRHIIPFETQCFIKNGEELIASGFASCSDLDMYSRKIGRKIAFGRALLHTGWDKGIRRKLWDTYFKEIGKSD